MSRLQRRVYWQDWLLAKERIIVYRQHIRQPHYQQFKVKEHLRFCSSGKFEIFPFLQMKQENRLLRTAYEDYIIDHFKPFLNQTLWVACVLVFMLFHLLVSYGCTTSVIYMRSSDQWSFVVSIFWVFLPSSFISISESILFHLQRRKLQPTAYWRENDMI